MHEKIGLAEAICSHDNGVSYPNMTECEIYGMIWGCDKYCPVFQRKKCEIQEENEKIFESEEEKMNKDEMIRNAISVLDIDDKYKEELIEYYDSLLDDSVFLSCLINAGVDNWEGYEFAQELLESEK